MKKLLFLLVSITFIFSCVNNPDRSNSDTANEVVIDNPNLYGEIITHENAADARRLPILLEAASEKEVTLIGKVDSVCQMSGCWLNMDLGDGKTIHVTFKDGEFVVPKDIAGKTVIMQGIASREDMSVELLKKIARNHGKSESEIDSIQVPLTEYYFEAAGLIVK